jgi:hypothetical protein
MREEFYRVLSEKGDGLANGKGFDGDSMSNDRIREAAEGVKASADGDSIKQMDFTSPPDPHIEEKAIFDEMQRNMDDGFSVQQSARADALAEANAARQAMEKMDSGAEIPMGSVKERNPVIDAAVDDIKEKQPMIDEITKRCI